MVKRRLGIIAFFVCLCFLLMPCYIQAVSTSDMTEPVIPDKECTLTITYAYNETPFTDVLVKLYKIAYVSDDYTYTVTPTFESLGLVLNGIQSNSEWNVIRSTVEAYIIASNIEPTCSVLTNGNGEACFDMLKTGLYLSVVGQTVSDDLRFNFDSALISLPDIDENGRMKYQVEASAKGEALPPITPDEKIQLKVLKLWRGDEGKSDRPKSIEVDIFRDGIIYQTVVLSESNNWSYTWDTKDDGTSWTVIEKNVPSGYTMSVEDRGQSFILTNTRKPDSSDTPYPPQTGDTSNIWFNILIMIVSGCLLIALGITGKRRIYEKAK